MKAARVHIAPRGRGCRVAARGACAADAPDWGDDSSTGERPRIEEVARGLPAGIYRQSFRVLVAIPSLFLSKTWIHRSRRSEVRELSAYVLGAPSMNATTRVWGDSPVPLSYLLVHVVARPAYLPQKLDRPLP